MEKTWLGRRSRVRLHFRCRNIEMTSRLIRYPLVWWIDEYWIRWILTDPCRWVGWALPLVPGGGEALLGGEGDEGQLLRVLLQLFHNLDQLFYQDPSVLLGQQILTENVGCMHTCFPKVFPLTGGQWPVSTAGTPYTRSFWLRNAVLRFRLLASALLVYTVFESEFRQNCLLTKLCNWL